ncbi:Protein of unknown function [Bacillus sp. OV322]|uniref:DUF2691 family protein n=1 Tax=Bacillus sp. OV322 TaxID=1882764 RepID=UPI0008EF7917|nr:DUF2691 family protein [Bacillus sp. OV322]SFC37684.1 Protein of unknown function [Bacillus sp. OV322]
MKRGITFEIPNEYGSFLWKVLTPFEITEFVWLSADEESYLVENKELREPLFPEEMNGMDSLFLRELLEENKYYLIFVNLQAYPKGKNPLHIETYDEYVNSNCQLVLLVVDSIYVTIYCKDKAKLEGLYQNAKLKGFNSLNYITDKNDTRTRLSV